MVEDVAFMEHLFTWALYARLSCMHAEEPSLPGVDVQSISSNDTGGFSLIFTPTNYSV
jgi:hypothetical protein